MGWCCQPHAQPPIWRTRVSLLVWAITFDLSGKGDPTSSYATAGIALRIDRMHYTLIILMILEFSRQIFEKVSSIKFHENPSSGSRVVPCGQTDMKKPVVAFRNIANAPNKTSKRSSTHPDTVPLRAVVTRRHVLS
jgi:hypothetical protein